MGIGFLPLLWKILEIVFLTSFSDALKILGQMALIGIIFKVFEESLINPLYKTLSKQNFNTEEDKQTAIHKFLIFYSMATLIFTCLLFIFSKYIMQFSKVPNYIFNQTLEFLNLYVFACGFGVIAKFLYTCSLINKDRKKMFIYFLIKSVVTTILFLILIPKFTFGLGVNGVAIAELIINVATIVFLLNNKVSRSKQKVSINIKEYLKLFMFAFIETLIRNAVYYFVILVFLNMLDNQDLYFVSNEFIWSVMLVPTLAQSSLIKQNLSTDKQESIKPYFVNSFVLIIFILLLIPVAYLVFKYIYQLPNFLDYFLVLIKLLPCYIIFVFDSVVEAYFISTGKLHHVLVQTIITNIFVYFTALVLYLFGIWTITLNAIILLFNLGVVISSSYTIIAYFVETKKLNKSCKT